MPPVFRRVSQESELISRAQEGDEAAFEHLYRLHSRQVYHLCLRMTRNRTESEDLTQEIFVQVYKKLLTFRGAAAFSSWLHRVAVNIVLMKYRKKHLSEVSSDEWASSDSESCGYSGALAHHDKRLAGCVDRLALESAVATLSPGYRAAFLLHDVFGYSYEEIACILDCTSGTCKSQLHKARLRLRQYFLGCAAQRRSHRHQSREVLCSLVSSRNMLRNEVDREELTQTAVCGS